ncbi:ABC transporter ATP-binding protein [Salipaludibacillus keqinensis]|uniref:ABC transporter ATP-binding protein n=1 Tax=Salipaludibacillus keqinensis TaxID=2045207 RepID=A0A323TJM1_9BACI|nr:ABC transporter ATP-binding protein [Salipaludibacillus keqinensis]PYZ94969.1 ABC transporter ATP-binding protein [Salipaludibacillus keqinensis]
MNSQPSTLVVKNLCKDIGKKNIIKNISFELKEGEVFGFLGPNGSGKTTTVRMLVGLIKPTSGEVYIYGHNLQQEFIQAIDHIGVIVENPELYPYLSGWENLEQFARMVPRIEQARLLEVVDLVGLQNRIHDTVKTYSLGMRQRLGIAQALLGNPKVLILDEPTNGLDPGGIREMREFIRTLAERDNISILVSSHLLSEIQLMCDRVAIISKGQIITVDSVEHLLAEKERVWWKLDPMSIGKTIVSEKMKIVAEHEDVLISHYDGESIANINEKLVHAGVNVHGIEIKLPTLEDLFIELTGGETID